MIWRGHWRQRIGVEIARAYEAPGKAEMGEPGQRDESLVDCEETESEGMEEEEEEEAEEEEEKEQQQQHGNLHSDPASSTGTEHDAKDADRERDGIADTDRGKSTSDGEPSLEGRDDLDAAVDLEEEVPLPPFDSDSVRD